MTSAGESSSVSEDEGVISLETRARFSEALQKIQRRDASIYDPNTETFFESASSESESEEKEETQAPLYLKDVRAQQLLEFGAAAYASSEEEEDEENTDQDPQRNAKRKREKFLYDEEQSRNRMEVMQAMEGEAESDEDSREFGGLQRVEYHEEEDAIQSETDSETERKKADVNKSLEDYFAHVTDLQKEDVEFLKEYIENEQWRVDKWGADDSDEEEVELEQDEAYLEKAAKFEADYNFRFEEPGSHEIVGHPRQLEGSLRKKESKRKRQRANKAERKRLEKEMEEQEIEQQKNQKRKEIQQKCST